MFFSTNSGVSWVAMGAGSVSGAFGAGVAAGERTAVWSASEQLAHDTFSNNNRIRVVAASGSETVTNTSSPFSIDLKGLFGGLTVKGRVLRYNRAALPDVLVTLGGQSATTAADGRFSLTNVALISGRTLRATKTDYVTILKELSTVSPGTTQIELPDILMASQSSAPCVTEITPSIKGIFLSGNEPISEMNCTYEASVNWGECSPEAVTFYANNTLMTNIIQHILDGDGIAKYACTMNMSGSAFTPSYMPLANTVKVVACGTNGGLLTNELARNVSIVPLPWGVRQFMGVRLPNSVPGMILISNIVIPPVGEFNKVRLNVPAPVGPFEFRLGASLRMGYDLASGAYELGLGAGGSGSGGSKETFFQNPLFAKNPLFTGKVPKVNASTGLIMGKNEIELYLQGVAMGMASPATGITLDAFKLAGGLDARVLLCYFTVGGVVPANVGNVLGDAMTWTSVALYAKVKLTGDVIFDVNPAWAFRELNGRVGLGLEACYEPSAFNNSLRFRLYIGGDGSVAVRYPPLGFGDCWLKLYAGGEVKCWFLKIPFGPFTLARYPSTGAQSLQLSVDDFLGAADFSHPQVMSRDYLKQGGEVFLVNPPDDAQPLTLAAQPLTPLEAFRLIGRTPDWRAGGDSASGFDALSLVPVADVWPRLSQVNLQLIGNCFPDSSPALAGVSSNLMMVYVADNGGESDLQFTDIRWSRYDGANWSEPAPIATDTRGEFNPQVKFDGNGSAVAVWERIKDPDFSELDLTAMAEQMEIVWSRWNPDTGTWAEPAALTDNAYLDHKPKLAGPLEDGDLLVAWNVNTSNVLAGATSEENALTTDSVMWSRWDAASLTWSAPEVLLDEMVNWDSVSFSASGDKAVFAWTAAPEGLTDGQMNQELYAKVWTGGAWDAARLCTSNNVADRNVRVELSVSGDVHMVWQQASNLVSSVNFSPVTKLVRSATSGLGFSDFALTYGPSGNMVVLWQEMTESGSDAHVAVYDPISDTWSQDICLFNDAALERSFAPVWDDVGNLTVAYNSVDVVTTNTVLEVEGEGSVTVTNMPQPGAVGLYVMKKSLITDVAIESGDFTISGANYLPGDAVTLSTSVRNVGDIAVTNLAVAFYQGNPASGGTLIATETWDGWLAGAATNAFFSTVWVVPEPATNLEFYAVANAAHLFAEFSENNNSQSLSAGGTDLSVSLVEAAAETNGAMRVIAKVKNIGAPGAPETTVALRYQGDGGTPLATAGVPALEPGKSAEIAFDLPAGTQPEGVALYVLKTDELNAVPDVETNNNEVSFSLLLWLDTDEDGMPDGWETEHGLDAADSSDAAVDADHDGMSNYAEWRAGTDAQDPDSYLSVTGFGPMDSQTTGTGFRLTWGSVANRFYTVSRSSNLNLPGGGFVPLSEHILASPPVNTYEDVAEESPTGAYFYRIDVE